MHTSKLKKYLIAGVVFLIIISVIGKKAGWFGGDKPINVSTEKVQKRTLYEVITANGKIEPETEIKVSADVSGEIIELHIKEGDAVEAGQLLLKIKPYNYISARDRANAAVNNTKANLENSIARKAQSDAQLNKSKLSYERNKKLWEQKSISMAEWEAANAEYEIAKADVDAAAQSVKSAQYNVKSAEASLNEANENLSKTSVYAPVTGVITKLNVEKGERVVGTEMMAGTELLRVADLHRMEVNVQVNENDIVRISTKDTVVIEVDAYLDQKFKGLVAEIANSASTSGQVSADQVTSFEVKIIMLEESYKQLISEKNQYPFRPGMTANVDIQTQMRTNVLSVPIEAVTSRTDSTKKQNKNMANSANSNSSKSEEVVVKEIVFVVDKKLARSKEVKTGIQDNNFIEIVSGLKEGEEIITAPYSAISRKLKDSVLVTVVDKKVLFTEK
jgi:HlyD family secretion protein